MSGIANLHFGVINIGVVADSESSTIQLGLDAQVEKLFGAQVALKGNIEKGRLFQLAPYATANEFFGLQIGAYAMSEYSSGLKLSLVDRTEGFARYFKMALVHYDQDMTGLRIGLINLSDTPELLKVYGPDYGSFVGFDIGILGISQSKSKFISIAGLYGKIEEMYGLAIHGLYSNIEKADGLIVSVLSNVGKKLDGLQIAPISIGPNNGNYIQIGLLTLRQREDGRGYDASPIIGWHFDK